MGINKYNTLVVFQNFTLLEKILSFVFTIIYAILVYLAYTKGYFGSLFILSILYLESGYYFYVARKNVHLKFPELATYNLYKSGDLYFVGCSDEEAQLFSEITGNSTPELIQKNVRYFDK